MKKITCFAEKLTNISLMCFNMYLVYKIFPNVLVSLVSIVCQLILEKRLLDHFSNGKYSKCLDEISQKILAGKDCDVTELNDVVADCRTRIITVNLCISMILIFIYQLSK